MGISGSEIRAARRNLGLSQEALASRAGFHRNSIWRLEQWSEVPSSSCVSASIVAGVLGLPPPFETFTIGQRYRARGGKVVPRTR